MTEAFDPYYRWLGIPPREQPPHLYRLLGLELFESNPDVIDAMASRHIEYLQEINDGPHLKLAQELLNELAAARRCLLNAEAKAAYDSTLRGTFQQQREPPVAAPPSEPPPATEVAELRISTGAANVRASSAGSPVHAKSRRSTNAQNAKNQTQLSKRRSILAASGLGCLIVLAIGGLWLASRGASDRDDLATAVDQAAMQQRTSKAAGPNPSRYPGQQASTAPSIAPANEIAVGGEVPNVTPTTIASVGSDASERIEEMETRDATAALTPVPPVEPLPDEGLLLWLDAADVTSLRASDGQLRSWDDKSSNRYRASVDSDGPGPELVPAMLDEKPAVRFSGNDWLKIDGTANLLQDQTDYTFIYVARGVRGTLVSNGTGEADPFSFALSPGVEGFRIGGQPRNATSDTSDEFHVRSLVVDANSIRWFVDGQPSGKLELPPQAMEKANVLRIGCSYRNRHGAESVFQGDLAELMIFGRALPEQERCQVESFVRTKWLSGNIAEFPFDTVNRPVADVTEDGPPEMGDTQQEEQQTQNDTTEQVRVSQPPDAESAPHSQGFIVLKPVHMEGSAGSQLGLRGDGAVLSDGQNKMDETYRITVETNIPRITAILLEALPDVSLPGRGPGLGAGGVFSLAEFSVTVRPQAESGSGRPVTCWQAQSQDAPQAKLSNDGDTATRWTVRRRAERVPILYIASEPFGDRDGSLIELTLVQRENLGCFRISATSATDPWKLPIPTHTNTGTGDDESTLFVNLGGDAWRDPDGNQWVESKSYVQGSFGHEGGQAVKSDETNNAVFGTARRGISAFRADVDPGQYEVHLIFNEHWTSAPKSRLFSVFIEQRPALGPIPGLGFGQPYIHRIPKVQVVESPLDIDFRPAHDGATTILNGVIIRRIK